MGVETANSFQQLESMVFYKFDKLIYYTSKYLDKKHETENGSGSAEEATETMQRNMSSSMRTMKNSFKMPKLK